jgi:hypothetical protein
MYPSTWSPYRKNRHAKANGKKSATMRMKTEEEFQKLGFES